MRSASATCDQFQTELQRLGDQDGRSRRLARSHHHSALGPGYLPEFEKRWKRYARAVGGSWRMDETYIKVRGRWVYPYRAVDKAGRTVDFFLSRNRDMNAAKSFLCSAMKNTRTPTKITLDAYAASHRAVRAMKEDGELPRRVKVDPANI